MPKKKSKARKIVDKTARKINKLSGATNLAKFTGETIAKRKNPAVKRTVTKKQAAKSGAKVGATIASLGAGGVIAKAAKVRKAAKARKAKKAVVQQSSSKFLKRSVGGHERAARQAAKKRASAKRRKK